MTKSTFAIVAAVPAIPPNPKIAAMIAITKNTTAQESIVKSPPWQFSYYIAGARGSARIASCEPARQFN
jgi:hypothetical protein